MLWLFSSRGLLSYAHLILFAQVHSLPLLLNYFLKIIFFICFQLCCVFVAGWAFLQLRWVGATLWVCCVGFSLWWALSLWNTGSRAQGLQYLWHMVSVVVFGLSSCGTQAKLLWGMWDLPGPGIEPMSFAWQANYFPLSHFLFLLRHYLLCLLAFSFLHFTLLK